MSLRILRGGNCLRHLAVDFNFLGVLIWLGVYGACEFDCHIPIVQLPRELKCCPYSLQTPLCRLAWQALVAHTMKNVLQVQKVRRPKTRHLARRRLANVK